MKKYILSNKSTNIIITALECCLTVSAVAVSIRDTYKAVNTVTKIKNDTDKTKRKTYDMCKGVAVSYIPTITITSLSIATNILMGVRNARIQTCLGSLAIIYATQYQSYKTHSIDIDTKKDVDNSEYANSIAQYNYYENIPNNVLFYDTHSGRYFWSNKESVMRAAIDINNLLINNGECTLQDFYDLLNLEDTKISNIIGWDLYSGETMYGYRWIDVEFYKKNLSDGREYYALYFPFEPHSINEYTDNALIQKGYDLDTIGKSGYYDYYKERGK